MKEAIGGISLFQIVVLFILLFAAIMAFSINHSKAFGVKDEIINIIQNEQVVGTELSQTTLEAVKDHLADAGYRVTGKCPDGYTGYDREGNENNNSAAFCIKANDLSNAFKIDLDKKCEGIDNCSGNTEDYPTMIYYDVVVFYQLNIPVLNNLFKFKSYASTKVLFGK